VVADHARRRTHLVGRQRLGYGQRVTESPSRSFGSPRKEHARALFAGLPGAYDWAGAALSFGQDPRWRRTMVGQLRVGPTDRVLDVAAGTGLVTAALRRTYDCDVVAFDQSPEMLGRARDRFRDDPRVRCIVGEAERLPFADGEFAALTFTYLLRYVDDVPSTLRELVRVVRPGGMIASLEFGEPTAPVFRFGWWAITRTVLPMGARLISPEWGAVGRFLGPNIERFARSWPPERLAREWVRAGVHPVTVRRMSFGAGVVMWGARSPD
jgi:demethylmenaquinone methyltransferase/2-methoxy-6-polyprenyl-1,4-benzoquinol methylase